MIILPAIDILGGKCVRLTRGAYESAEKVAVDPVETALSFMEAGAEFIHMVDLDGARDGKPVNFQIYADVVKDTGLPVEVGGGIRNIDTVKRYFDCGVERVILGSAAVNDRSFVERAVKEYGGKIAVGIDALGRKVKTSGWLQDSDVDYIDLAKDMENIGVEYIIYTDISRDGTLSGPSVERLAELSQAVKAKVIASGGIRDIENVRCLCNMSLYGAILGKSIYSGNIDLGEAIKLSQGRM